MATVVCPSSESPDTSSRGVSVIVCCHNSSERLPTTLEYLNAQECDSIPWEIVLVDNASTDDTANVARNIWSHSACRTPLRVVTEANLGLAFARQRGVSEADYEFLCFVDDDNWVSRDWVKRVWNVMTRNPRVAACGGTSQAEFGTNRPAWFDSYAHLYAVMPESEVNGDVTFSRTLWGAGLTIRRSALNQLSEQFGFESVLVGRRGTQLSSGEDTELCLALRLAGWSLWLEPSLKFCPLSARATFVMAIRFAAWPTLPRVRLRHMTLCISSARHHGRDYYALCEE